MCINGNLLTHCHSYDIDIRYSLFGIFHEKENGFYWKTRFAGRAFRTYMTRDINENISENFSLYEFVHSILSGILLRYRNIVSSKLTG